jgi:hypothetical protein
MASQRAQLSDRLTIASHGERLASGDPFKHGSAVVPQVPYSNLAHGVYVSPVRQENQGRRLVHPGRCALTKGQSDSNHLLYNYLQESPVAVQR